MGRYYNGDIEGKFWFGVQSSDDADFFGVEGKPRFYHYYFSEDDKKKVHKGLLECSRVLQGYMVALDKFFEEHDSYNDKMLLEFLNKNVKGLTTEEKAKELLEWYARLHLGRKIYKCIDEQGECDFEAEL
jgi:hypothetical protein